ncbi:MAG: GNAT family N-acetyltransferase [Caldilinea sp. CFX5]|nr:GNAT family N-acetyltransferase [Caldilinea sp. CFX5]
MSFTIRRLTPDDAAAYQPVRLRSLQEHPEAFGSAYEDELTRPLSAVAERLQALPGRFTLGAWQADTLAGIVTFAQAVGRKVCHRGGVGGMYVAAEARGLGIGRALMTDLVERAGRVPMLEEIILAVTVGNVAARSIYLAAGFQPAHVEKRYIKVADCYYDIEWMTLLLEKSRV